MEGSVRQRGTVNTGKQNKGREKAGYRSGKSVSGIFMSGSETGIGTRR